MELKEAILRISEIHTQLARTERFQGFRSLTVGFSGALGILAAVIQANCVPEPTERLGDYLRLWVGAALVSLVVVGIELAYRWMTADSPLKHRLTVQAIQQFSPCLVAGAIITTIIASRSPHIAWVLPGLWSILFSLGIFACTRLLPNAITWVGVYYMVAGSLCLTMGHQKYALSPWLMVGSFGIGQFLAAVILAYTLEQRDEQE